MREAQQERRDMTREGRQARRFVNQLAQERGSRREERDAIDVMQLNIYNNQPNLTKVTAAVAAAIMPRRQK